MNVLSAAALKDWINKAADVLDAQKAYLTELDAPIGDSDHGANMARGFAAAKAKLDQNATDAGAVLKSVAMTLISTVGGASGPLYGTLFLQAAGKAAGKTELTLSDWTSCLEAGLAGVVMRGKAELGDKTMVDALTPAIAALKEHASAPLPEALAISAQSAELGMQATTPLLARKGRASYLGERSIGHQDPGATSSYFLLQALAEVAAS
ncbi:dihydroxyacetone kinase subunit DhaL [Methylovirgula sp. 4M-Z18]|uniref:dihydroxyacetone kinase subunit DhaL n=1 Tax=Methylovirgula sp. 4M-Z18 TaxID=2293567 RepID=UPI000E2F926F|nr:dihydroxyacetone kinase subunit DhaL [Methylovirgula sp. 4M-Z18]RFB80503.1 dihydroxyacetone kinase subunit L [Methylovirgula sp. 4M-Z18]